MNRYSAKAFYSIRLVGEGLSEIVVEHAHLSRNSVGAFSLILSGGFLVLRDRTATTFSFGPRPWRLGRLYFVE
jgi:hypothetical protein